MSSERVIEISSGGVNFGGVGFEVVFFSDIPEEIGEVLEGFFFAGGTCYRTDFFIFGHGIAVGNH